MMIMKLIGNEQLIEYLNSFNPDLFNEAWKEMRDRVDPGRDPDKTLRQIKGFRKNVLNHFVLGDSGFLFCIHCEEDSGYDSRTIVFPFAKGVL